MNLNKVILIGRISQQPLLFNSNSGINYSRFNIAITRDRQNSAAEETTDFIPLVAFGSTAMFIQKYFNKGDLISVVGTIQMSQYTTKSGDIASSASVLVDQIKSLEPLSVTQQRAEKRDTTTINTRIEQSAIEPKGDINHPSFKEESTEESDNPWELDL